MPAMSKQQANEIVAQLDQEERLAVALDEFVTERCDEVGPFLCGSTGYENIKKMTVWGLTNLGREPLTTISGWEICWNNTRASLVADANWQPLTKVFGDFEASITAAQWKQIYAGEVPGNLRADQRAALERIGGPEGFKTSIDGGKQ